MQTTGTCKYCGQVATVEALTEEEANRIATAKCDCDEAKYEAKKEQTLIDAENTLRNHGEQFVPLKEEIINLCMELVNLTFYGKISNVTIREVTSVIKIKDTKDGIRISREKTLKTEELC